LFYFIEQLCFSSAFK